MANYRDIEKVYRSERLRLGSQVALAIAFFVGAAALYYWWVQQRPVLSQGAIVPAEIVGLHGDQNYGPPSVSAIAKLESGRRVLISYPSNIVLRSGMRVSLIEMIAPEGHVHSYRFVGVGYLRTR